MKFKNKLSSKPKQKTNVKEEAKSLVNDLDAVKRAIETCLEWERENNIQLIHPKGKNAFSGIYKKKESKNKVRRLIDESIDEKLAPVLKDQRDMIKGQKDIKKIADTIVDEYKALNNKLDSLMSSQAYQEKKPKKNPKKNKKRKNNNEIKMYDPSE